MLAEKVATAIALGPANTRVRDYADIYTLTGTQQIAFRVAREALLATAAHRGTPVLPLSEAVGNIADLRSQAFGAYRASLGGAGLHLLTDFRSVVNAVTAFADPLTADADDSAWQPTERQWTHHA